MKLLERYKRLTLWNKASFLGTTTSFAVVVVSAISGLWNSVLSSPPGPYLCYYFNPVRVAVYKSGALDGVALVRNGVKIEGDVTIAQVGVWNSGRGAIRSAQVLDSVKVVLKPPVPILDARVQQQSRHIVGARTTEIDASSATIPIEWNILEHRDAFLVNVAFVGGADVSLSVEGVIEGQPQVVKFDPAMTQVHKTVNQPGVATFFGVMTLGIAICFGLFALLNSRNTFRESAPFRVSHL